jgi:hypothetical protein
MLNFNASKCREMAGDSEIAKTSKIIFGDPRMTLPAGVTFQGCRFNLKSAQIFCCFVFLFLFF